MGTRPSLVLERGLEQPLEGVVVLGVEAADALHPDPGRAQPVGQQPAGDDPAASAWATRPARARIWMCLEIAASDMACGSASSPTVRSPASSAVRIARRVRSAERGEDQVEIAASGSRHATAPAARGGKSQPFG